MAISRRELAVRSVGLLAGLRAGASMGQGTPSFPTRPVRLIVTSAPGNVTDTNARLLAAKLSQRWGQPVVVEQKVGANGSIGAEYVTKQPPDGHTLLMTTTSLVQTLAIRKTLPYDIFKDLAPITPVFVIRLAFVVDAKLGVSSLADFISLARSQPSKLAFASFGVGSTAHMVLEKLNYDAKIAVLHVPYQGTAPAINALLSGEVNSAVLDIFLARQHVASGKLKLLASTGARRSRFSPDTPTFGEAGLPGFATDNWAGWFAPGGTPEPVLTKIADDIRAVLALPDVANWYNDAGVEFAAASPQEFARTVRRDADYWIDLVNSTGMKASS